MTCKDSGANGLEQNASEKYMTPHRYVAFGLRVQSTWPIPSLTRSGKQFAGPPDVQITEGDVPTLDSFHEVDGLQVHVDRRAVFIGIEECGRFQVIGGRRIIIDAYAGVSRDQINLYLLGSVFGILLHQRCILPIHCNAVEMEGAAFLFCGDSGAGKSTLAAYFVDRGLRLLADDVCGLHFLENSEIVAAPGFSRLKLWRDALEAFGTSSAGLNLLPWHQDKFEVSLTGAGGHESVPIAAIYHLRVAGNERSPGIYRLKGLEAANSVTANIYRRRLADFAGAAAFYLNASARILDRVPVFTMNRKWGFEHFHDEALAAEQHMHHIIEHSCPSRN